MSVPNDPTSTRKLWSQFVIHYKQFDKGTWTFVTRELLPLLKTHQKRLRDAQNNASIGHVVEYPLNPDSQILKRYINSRGQHTRTDPDFLRMIAAYVSIKKEMERDPRQPITYVGQVIGRFLRDPVAYQSRLKLAVSGQKVKGIYRYPEKDVLRRFTGSERFLAFMEGTSPDYMLIFDFYCNLSDATLKISAESRKELLKLTYGFCAPGLGLSPIVARSLNLGERLLGLVYSQNALVEFDSAEMDALRYDVLTTDPSRYMLQSGAENSGMAQARLLYEGPHVNYKLTKVKNVNEISILEKRIALFNEDLLQ